MREILQS